MQSKGELRITIENLERLVSKAAEIISSPMPDSPLWQDKRAKWLDDFRNRFKAGMLE